MGDVKISSEKIISGDYRYWEIRIPANYVPGTRYVPYEFEFSYKY